MKKPDIINLVQIALLSKLNINHVTLIYLLLHDMNDLYTTLLNNGLVDDNFILSLKDKGYYVGMKNNIPILHQSTKDMFTGFISRTTTQVITDELKRIESDEKLMQTLRVETWIDEYRNLFKGTRPKAMGIKAECIKKMRWFVSEYKYDKEHILQATKKYIEDKAKDSYKYIRQADYFIRKQEEKHGEQIESSDLLIYCEEYVPVENEELRNQWKYGMKLG